jgi:hypothetical protein
MRSVRDPSQSSELTKAEGCIISCGNEDGSETRWGVFVTAERGLLQRISRRAGPHPTVAELEAHLTEIVEKVPDAEDIRWES